MSIQDAIHNAFVSPNVADSNLEPANLVDVVHSLARQVSRVSDSITAPASAGHDACGGAVSSLTEAVMGVTGGLCRIAEAIEHLAEGVQAMGEKPLT